VAEVGWLLHCRHKMRRLCTFAVYYMFTEQTTTTTLRPVVDVEQDVIRHENSASLHTESGLLGLTGHVPTLTNERLREDLFNIHHYLEQF